MSTTPRLTSLCAATLALLGFTACDIDQIAALESMEINSNLLAEVIRADGTPIADVVGEIEKKYGFRAQTMNFVTPTLNIHLTSPLTTVSPSKLRGELDVVDWATQISPVVNDAYALPFVFSVDGLSSTECDGYDGCVKRGRFDAYGDFFAAKVVEGLQAELKLNILGQNGDGNSVVRSLAPAKVEYNCVIDQTEIDVTYERHSADLIDLESAIQCAGKVQFVLE